MDVRGLAERHEVRLVDESPIQYRLRVLDKTPELPMLDRQVAAWRDPKTGKPFEDRDLAPGLMAITAFDATTKVITVAPVSWGRYVCISNPEIREGVPLEEHFKVLTVGLLAATSDDLFVVSWRSEKLSHFANTWHVSAAGYSDLVLAKNSLSAVPQAYLEAEQELNLRPSDIEWVRQTGMCEMVSPSSASCEVMYEARLRLTGAELLERAKDAKDKWEGKVHVKSPVELLELVEGPRGALIPCGAAAFLVALQKLGI